MKPKFTRLLVVPLILCLAGCSAGPTATAAPTAEPTSAAAYPAANSSNAYPAVETPANSAVYPPAESPTEVPAVSTPESSDQTGQLVQSDKVRAAAPSVPETDSQELAAGNTAFAVDLYHTLNTADQNLFFSPYSISLALAMTYAGARSDTETQMASTLHFTLPQDSLHPAFNALDQELASRADTINGQTVEGKGFQLNIVNDLWGEQTYTFLPDYLDLLAENYGAGMRLMDFTGDPDGSRQIINDYIASQTNDRIQDLVPSGAIDDLTRLVLTNAVYFNAAWNNQFIVDLTTPAPFTKLDGTQVDVNMMSMDSDLSLDYLAGEGYQAVALPYENTDLAMLLIVPDEGEFSTVANALTADDLTQILSEMQSQLVVVKMPRFTFSSSFDLSQTLQSLGMTDAFSSNADFSGMDGSNNLAISQVIHQAFVAVDENGTEAAAATMVGLAMKAMPQQQEPIHLTIDRPFLFLIVDRPTQTILFLGQTVDIQE